MSQLLSIRLRPSETEFLATQSFDEGSVFYDKNKNTLVLMNGQFRGGFELLRADLSNILAGNISFGSSTLTAGAFVGDGSQLTNLPIPANIATQTYVDTAVTTAFNTAATASTLGTVKVDGTTILINADGVISSPGGGGGGGGGAVDLSAFSVIVAAVGSTTLAYNNTTGVFTYTPPDLSGYLTSYTETDTLASVAARGSSTDSAVTINNLLSAASLTVNTTAVVAGDVTAQANLSVGDALYATDIINIDIGVPRWTSGSDFIIDAAGEVNVSGSKITNLSLPTVPTDAANKAYVDGAASAFSGGTVSGAINITNTTQSTNKDTGALIVNGGAGIENDVYVGGIVYVFDTNTSTYSPVLTSASGGYNGGIISGTVFINNSTVSTSATTGALRVSGGVGIQGALTAGSDATFNGIRIGRGAGPSLGSNTNVAVGGGTGNDTPLAVNVTGARNIAVGTKTIAGSVSASDNVAIGHNAMANKTNGNFNVAVGSDALKDGAGGSNTAVGAGALALSSGDTNTAVGHEALHSAQGTGNIGLGFTSGRDLAVGNYNVIIGNNNGLLIDGTNNNIIISDGEGNTRISSNSTGTVTVPGNVTSTTTGTGALVVSGGVGIAGTLNVGTGFNVTSSTNSTSTNSGSIVTAGGIGAAGNVYAGAFYGDGSGLTNILASGFSGGTVAGLTSFTFTGTGSAATSTVTGAVRISAGLGVQGRVHAGNFNGVVVPNASTAPGANAFVRTDGNGWAYTNYINANNAVETITAPANFIVTNGGGDQNFLRKTSTASVKTGLGITAIIGTPASLYGAVAIQGAKNNWGGISFRNAANQLCGTLMMTTTAQGIYNAADNAWLLQWDQAGNFTATANITAYSDHRLKENIQVIPDALNKVLQLDGVTFTRKKDGTAGTGVIAQQLQTVLPQAVIADQQGMLSVAYGNTVGLLIEAIKEQQRQIDFLRAEITALKR